MLIKVWSLFADEGSQGKQTCAKRNTGPAGAGGASFPKGPFPRVQRGHLRKCSERAKGGGAGGRGAAGASVQTFVEIDLVLPIPHIKIWGCFVTNSLLHLRILLIKHNVVLDIMTVATAELTCQINPNMAPTGT